MRLMANPLTARANVAVPRTPPEAGIRVVVTPRGRVRGRDTVAGSVAGVSWAYFVVCTMAYAEPTTPRRQGAPHICACARVRMHASHVLSWRRDVVVFLYLSEKKEKEVTTQAATQARTGPEVSRMPSIYLKSLKKGEF